MSEEQKRQWHCTHTQIDYKPVQKRTVLVVKCKETGEIFPTTAAASRAYNIDRGSIGAAARGKVPRAGGLHWEEVLPPEKYKYIDNAFYCIELEHYYESFLDAKRKDNFAPVNLKKALVKGDPYKNKFYAGFTFQWINPEKHLVL